MGGSICASPVVPPLLRLVPALGPCLDELMVIRPSGPTVRIRKEDDDEEEGAAGLGSRSG